MRKPVRLFVFQKSLSGLGTNINRYTYQENARGRNKNHELEPKGEIHGQNSSPPSEIGFGRELRVGIYGIFWCQKMDFRSNIGDLHENWRPIRPKMTQILGVFTEI